MGYRLAESGCGFQRRDVADMNDGLGSGLGPGSMPDGGEFQKQAAAKKKKTKRSRTRADRFGFEFRRGAGLWTVRRSPCFSFFSF